MSYTSNKQYQVNLMYTILSVQVITVLGQPAGLNLVNVSVSFCVWKMRYAKANIKASSELRMYLRVF